MMTSLDYHSESCDCESCEEAWTVLCAERCLDTLASNLAIAAALTRAFMLGTWRGGFHMFDEWTPGCQRPAP